MVPWNKDSIVPNTIVAVCANRKNSTLLWPSERWMRSSLARFCCRSQKQKQLHGLQKRKLMRSFRALSSWSLAENITTLLWLPEKNKHATVPASLFCCAASRKHNYITLAPQKTTDAIAPRVLSFVPGAQKQCGGCPWHAFMFWNFQKTAIVQSPPTRSNF